MFANSTFGSNFKRKIDSTHTKNIPSKFSNLSLDVAQHATAKGKLQIKDILIPELLSYGYSEEMLQSFPNTAEGKNKLKTLLRVHANSIPYFSHAQLYTIIS